jgi:tRNA(Arg) A34 adenosine deaminase TadA
MRVDKFFHMAAAEARDSELDIKHGALLVSGGKVIAAGHNSSRATVARKFGVSAVSTLLGRGSSCSMHSEVAALHNGSWIL